MKQQQKDTIREEFRKLQEITLDYGQLGTTKSYLLNEPQHNKICDWWLQKLDQAYQQGFKAGAKDKVEEMLKSIKEVNKKSYKELRPFERNWYQAAIQTITKIIKR